MTISLAYEKVSDIPSRLRFEITVSNSFNGRSFPEKAKVDTGADGTEIPTALKKKLELVPHGEVTVGYGNQLSERKVTYLADISFDGYTCRDIEVTIEERSDILLGRDVLNQFKMHCDGINEIFTFEK
jgi:hypothetical protein